MVDAKPDVVLTATEWVQQAKVDNNFVITKHAGKVLELTGEVYNVFTSFGNTLALKAAAEVKDVSLDVVACEMRDKEFWKKVFIGQTVRLRATAPSSTVGGFAFEWEIIEVKGPKPPTVSADDWVKEFEANPEAAKRKYENRQVIITGEIGKVEPNGTGVGIVHLKTKQGAMVSCRFPLNSEEVIKSLMQGQKVSLLFKYNELGIDQCLVFDRPL